MGHWSTYGVGRYQAAESDLLIAPQVPNGRRTVLYDHGAGGTGAAGVDSSLTGQFPLLQGLGEMFPVLGADLGGATTWGNATAQTRAETLRAYAGTAFGLPNGKVHLLGASMGALTALQYAKANPSKVASIALIIPALDLDYAYQNNIGGHQADIGTAWGVSFPTALPAAAKVLDDTSSWDAIPVKIWYVTNDVYTPTASSTTFIANAGATGVSLGALGHTEAAIAAVPVGDVAAFFGAL